MLLRKEHLLPWPVLGAPPPNLTLQRADLSWLELARPLPAELVHQRRRRAARRPRRRGDAARSRWPTPRRTDPPVSSRSGAWSSPTASGRPARSALIARSCRPPRPPSRSCCPCIRLLLRTRTCPSVTIDSHRPHYAEGSSFRPSPWLSARRRTGKSSCRRPANLIVADQRPSPITPKPRRRSNGSASCMRSMRAPTAMSWNSRSYAALSPRPCSRASRPGSSNRRR